MGCPVPKIVNNGEGSALMKNPERAKEVLTAMVDVYKRQIRGCEPFKGMRRIIMVKKLITVELRCV